MEIPPGKGDLIKKFPDTRKLSHWWVWGKFLNLGKQPN